VIGGEKNMEKNLVGNIKACTFAHAFGNGGLPEVSGAKERDL